MNNVWGYCSSPMEKVGPSSFSTRHCSRSKAPIGWQEKNKTMSTPGSMLWRGLLYEQLFKCWLNWPPPHQSGNKRGSWRWVSLVSSSPLQETNRNRDSTFTVWFIQYREYAVASLATIKQKLRNQFLLLPSPFLGPRIPSSAAFSEGCRLRDTSSFSLNRITVTDAVKKNPK